LLVEVGLMQSDIEKKDVVARLQRRFGGEV
jgi:hypothetical protein